MVVKDIIEQGRLRKLKLTGQRRVGPIQTALSRICSLVYAEVSVLVEAR